MLLRFTTVLSTLFALALSAAVKKRDACASYTLINTRGTGEIQGPSIAFRTMNANIQRQVPGGKIYNTVYSAGITQVSTDGSSDIVKHIQSTLQTNPSECFILEGYSQGAAATVGALPRLTGANFDAVKGVFLVGNPNHKAGLACNVDSNGGDTTRNSNGLEAIISAGIPSNWVSKTLDVCAKGDGVCDTTNGFGISIQHLTYSTNSQTQNLGTQFVVGKLKGTA